MPTPRRRTAPRKRNTGRRPGPVTEHEIRSHDPSKARTISHAEAERIRAAYQANENARRIFDPKRYQKGGAYSPSEVAKIAEMAGSPKPDNEDLGALELYDFVHAPPDRYFLYVDENVKPSSRWGPRKDESKPYDALGITWGGQTLGTIYYGKPFRAASFGGKSAATERVPITFYGVNGKRYVGTYFSGAGTYARVRLAKG